MKNYKMMDIKTVASIENISNLKRGEICLIVPPIKYNTKYISNAIQSLNIVKDKSKMYSEEDTEISIFTETFDKLGLDKTNLVNFDSYMEANCSFLDENITIKYIFTSKLLRSYLQSGYKMFRVNVNQYDIDDLMYYMSYDESKLLQSQNDAKKVILLFNIQDSHIDEFDKNTRYWPIELASKAVAVNSQGPIIVGIANVIVQEFVDELNQ